MRCHICNKVIETPIWDRMFNDYSPCPTCQHEINEILEGYRDVASAAEDVPWEESVSEWDENADNADP